MELQLDEKIDEMDKKTESSDKAKAKACRVMTNPVVLDKIRELLSVKEILDLRETCPLWNDNFLTQLRAKHTPIWLTARRPPENPSDERARSIIQYTEELKPYVNLGGEMSFARYRIEGGFRPRHEEEVSVHLYNFFSAFGNWISSLHLQYNRYDACADLPLCEVEHVLFEWAPSLVDLQLEACEPRGRNSSPPAPPPRQDPGHSSVHAICHGYLLGRGGGRGGGRGRDGLCFGPGPGLPFTSSPDSKGMRSKSAQVVRKPIPNLRRFKFVTVDPSTRTRVNATSTFIIRDVLQYAPGLESLSLKNLESWSLTSSLETLLKLRDDDGDSGSQGQGQGHVYVGKLKTLKLTHVGLPELRILLELSEEQKENANASAPRPRLRLETLTLTIVCSSEEQETWKETVSLLHKFLAAQAKAGMLRKLSLGFVPPRSRRHHAHADHAHALVPFGMEAPAPAQFGLPIRVPRIPTLRTFKLTRDGTEVGVTYEDGEHGTLDLTFPALKHSIYRNRNRQASSATATQTPVPDDLGRISHSRASELSLHASGNNFMVTIAKFRPIFPSVTRLRLDLEAIVMWDTLNQIWTLWPALKSLHLRIDYNYWSIFPGLQLDAFLVGLEPLNVSKMPGLKTEFGDLIRKEDTEALRTLRDKYKSSTPGISDAKQLEEFRLELINGSGSQLEVTDIGGYLGLGLAGLEGPGPRLQHISLRGVGVGRNLISEECKAFIRDVVGPAAVLDI